MRYKHILMSALISLSMLSIQGKYYYSITYQVNENIITSIVAEPCVTIRADEEWDTEYYDSLSQTVHISPGRLLGN